MTEVFGFGKPTKPLSKAYNPLPVFTQTQLLATWLVLCQLQAPRLVWCWLLTPGLDIMDIMDIIDISMDLVSFTRCQSGLAWLGLTWPGL